MNCVADGHECQCPAPHPNCEAVVDARLWMTAAMRLEHGVNAAITTGSPLDEIERLEREITRLRMLNERYEDAIKAALETIASAL